MQRWSGKADVYKKEPTWYCRSKGYYFNEKIEQLGFYGVRDIAKRHYDWLKDQPGATTPNGHCMVAAFWDPNTQTVWASSIPLGPRKAIMIGTSRNKGAAPSWFNQVDKILNPNKAKIHAEDGAYYNYETSTDAQANNGRYPEGSMIAIYGKYIDKNPGPIDPCGAGENARDPSCMAVANALGVRYKPNAADRALSAAQQAPQQPAEEAPPTADPQAAPADVELGDDLTDEDWETAFAQIQAGTGQGGQQQQKRHRISDHRLRKRAPSAASSAVSAVSNSSAAIVSGWLASVDALIGSFIPTSASIVNFSLSLPPIDFRIPPATNAATTGTITSGINSPSNTNAAPTGTITPGPSKTGAGSPPSIACFQQNEDPDSGIEQQGCICNSGTVTETLPILSTNVSYASSCAYTELKPSNTIAITTDWGPAMTNTQICSVCTPTTDFGVGTCTSIPNCLPETPSATMQIGSSPVPVGTLTSAKLVSSISSAISALCPLASTGCDQKTKIPIKGIVYVEEDQIYDDGELLVQIDSAAFKQAGDSVMRSALFGMAAHSFAAAAAGSNCANHTYTFEELRKRRDDDYAVGNNGTDSAALEPRDHPYPVQEKILLCNAGHFASPQYYAQDWREAENPGPQDYVSVEINFKTGPEGALICDFIKAFSEFVEAVFTPELLPEEQVADNEIGMLFL